MKNLLIILITFFPSITGYACDCKSIQDLGKTQEYYSNNSDVIFIGKIIESDSNAGTYKLLIVEPIKGIETDTVLIGKYFDSCSFFMNELLDLWLVYADFQDSEFLRIDDCGLTRRFNAPFLSNKNASVPPPPPPTDNPVIQMEHEFQVLEYRKRALKVLNEEIIGLRREFVKE